jgi:hypothetical protein
MTANHFKSQISIFLGVGLLLAGILPAQANLKELKMYKEAFPSSKVKCSSCHTDEKPKKEDGQHELNAYGQEVLKTSQEITVETFKKVGPVEDFKK